MATKRKKKTTHAPRKRHHHKAPAKRRRKSKPRGLSAGLPALVQKINLMDGAKKTFFAMSGGKIGNELIKLIPNATTGSKIGRFATISVIGILGHSFGWHNMTSGAVGAMMAQTFPNFLADDDNASFADDNILADGQPIFMDDDGNAMVLEEGPNGASWRYLSDEEVMLADRAGAFDDYTVVN